MVRRIIRSVALSAAILTAGFTTLLATPTTAAASEKAAKLAGKDTVEGKKVKAYNVKLTAKEPTVIRVLAADDAPVILALLDDDEEIIKRVEVPAGEVGEIKFTPKQSGNYIVAVGNPGAKKVTFALLVE